MKMAQSKALLPLITTVVVISTVGYLIFGFQSRNQTLAPQSLEFDIASNTVTARRAGDVYFLNGEASLSIDIGNSTVKDVDLHLLSKSCGCINVPEKLHLAAGQKTNVQLLLSNHAHKAGLQRISMAYGCQELDRVMPIEITYLSVIPVRCVTEGIYPVIGRSGQVTIEIESTLTEDIPKPTIDNPALTIAEFSKNNNAEPRKYTLRLSHGVITQSLTCQLHFAIKQTKTTISVPIHLASIDRFVVRDLRNQKADAANSNRSCQFIIQRIDGTPFRIIGLTANNDVAWEEQIETANRHLVTIRTGPGWDMNVLATSLKVTTDSEDQMEIAHTLYFKNR